MSSVTRSAWGGHFCVLQYMYQLCGVFKLYDLTAFVCGCSILFRCPDAVCVGPFVHETMGLSFTGSLCILGMKYIVCVSTLLVAGWSGASWSECPPCCLRSSLPSLGIILGGAVTSDAPPISSPVGSLLQWDQFKPLRLEHSLDELYRIPEP